VKITSSILAILFLGGHSATAQPIALGIEGGIRATEDFRGSDNPVSSFDPESQRYLVGPKLEVRLPLHLSFEFDALYRDVGFTGYSLIGPCCSLSPSVTRERDASWEFPMMVKYHFGVRMHPFLGFGFVPRTVHGSDVFSGSRLTLGGNQNYLDQRSNVSYPVSLGLVVSAGVEFGARHLSVSPELRYVHWNQPFLDQPYYNGAFNQDELLVLMSVAWRGSALGW
jgi:hypothetical protein